MKEVLVVVVVLCCAWIIPMLLVKSAFRISEERYKKRAERLDAEIREEEKRQKAKEAAEKRLAYLLNTVSKRRTDIANVAHDIDIDIRRFVLEGRFMSNSSIVTYNSALNCLQNKLDSIKSFVSDMEKANDALVCEYPDKNMSHEISAAKSKFAQALIKMRDFGIFAEDVLVFGVERQSCMLCRETYGKINNGYWHDVGEMSRSDTVGYISDCENYFVNGQIDKILGIDLEKLLHCVWFFAVEKPFSSLDFQKAKDVFNRVYKGKHVDIVIADLYARNSMGGEDAIREPVRSLLKQERSNLTLTLVASSLMWMNAYQTESIVLQHMLNNGMEMSAKAQERLHALTNGGGNAPSGYDVKSSDGEFYFDISALAWRDDEYSGLFENLAFQDKSLTYALAIRDENKELFIPQGIAVPSASAVENKLNVVCSEEYEDTVTVQRVACIALSGNSKEIMEGTLVSSNNCKQMGIMMHIAKIGKKLIIKFYTLFIPTCSDLTMQKQQALSIYQKLSPTVTMWESSLKDTLLMAVEQLLNSSAQGENTFSASSNESTNNEPYF